MSRLLAYESLGSFAKRCHQTRRRLYMVLGIGVIFTLIIYSTSSWLSELPQNQTTGQRKYRIRPQNASAFHYVKFRDLTKLTKLCESIPTIQCLKYLHQNQSDYLRQQSFDEWRTFRDAYCSQARKMLYHTIWMDARRLDHPSLQLHIYSYLRTQNRQCSHLIVWMLPPVDAQIIEAYNRLYTPNVEFRTLLPYTDQLRQVGVHIGSHWSGLPWRWLLPGRAQIGDAVRFILLHHLGGIYVDADALYLRDLQPFFAHEFAYRWSILDGFNTAVLRLFPQSNVSSIVINRARQTQSSYTFLPSGIHSFGLPTSFHRLPCALFDPIWLTVDEADRTTQKEWKLSSGFLQGFKDPFLRQSEISRRGRTVFDGAFTFHWHSSSTPRTFEPGSYVHQWYEFLNT